MLRFNLTCVCIYTIIPTLKTSCNIGRVDIWVRLVVDRPVHMLVTHTPSDALALSYMPTVPTTLL